MTTSTDPSSESKETSNSAPVRVSTTEHSSAQSALHGKEKNAVLSESSNHVPRHAAESEAARDDDASPTETAAEELRRTVTAGEEFSVLTVTQKKFVVMTASLAALFSPMATAIYCQSPTFSHAQPEVNVDRSIPRYHISRS